MTDSTPDLHSGCVLNARVCRLDQAQGYGMIESGAVAWSQGKITYVGDSDSAPRHGQVIDAGGALLTPGLIDCHTHLVFGGDRANEFEMRLQGRSYQDIAAAGGGIASTVRATREADDHALLLSAEKRARQLLADGVTTLEVKSGYGLSEQDELRMLRVARELGALTGQDVCTTFLGAHALPPEYVGRADDYIDLVCHEMLPAVAVSGVADAVDAFCETVGFSLAQTRRVFEAARRLGLPVKLHADQLSDGGGAGLVAEFKGLSADHIEYTSEQGVQAMAGAGTVGVLLPAAFYALRETQLPPIQRMRELGVPMAVATDLNPGTSPITSLRLALSMACTLFRLTPEEALRGTTVNAARALGLADRGQLKPGMRADLVLWDAEQPAELSYWIGGLPPRQVWIGGGSTH
ncbi:imidazolonepropionase [Pseudomarimonas arenosa]|uniref:Imidazolonepropionase n=1 Tax=Pseudomarimonas arenosa TaxID=2774145 RepID=A0AAW3ZNU7_9GAMM|nr:imidazolonepropionase [Pseudomarimonas arenosa]MBD8526600.1 imidazolonepropionase [Pseudomarimonas arenosa]